MTIITSPGCSRVWARRYIQTWKAALRWLQRPWYHHCHHYSYHCHYHCKHHYPHHLCKILILPIFPILAPPTFFLIIRTCQQVTKIFSKEKDFDWVNFSPAWPISRAGSPHLSSHSGEGGGRPKREKFQLTSFQRSTYPAKTCQDQAIAFG